MDIHLHYREKGMGEPLLLLHGNGEDGSYFYHQVKYFSREYRVFALDTRGHGWSPRGFGEFTLDRFAEDLKNFMDEHHLNKASLLGFSDGANIALLFALKYPQMVKKLILNGGNLDTKGVKPVVQIPVEIECKVAAFLGQRSFKWRKKAEILGLMYNQPNICPEKLGRIHLPVLVIAGTKDMIKEAHTRLMYENLPEAELVFISGDHFVAKKNPKEFNSAVEAFLKK